MKLPIKIQITKLTLILFIGVVFTIQSHAFSPQFKIKEQIVTPKINTKLVHDREIIILIHGLLRTYMSMSTLKSYLENYGYEVYYYPYQSSKYSIHEHAVSLNQFVDRVLKENPGIKIHFITHSLGGIIIREALSQLTATQLKHVGSLIMLAPPNQGSWLARLSLKIVPILNSYIKPLAELSSDQTSYVHRVPVPNIKMGIIAGRFDAKVPPSSARLDGQRDPVIINTNHTFIMNNSQTRKLIIHFLEKGRFGD